MLHEDEVLPRGTESPFLSALHAKNDTTNLFGCKLGESTLFQRIIVNYGDLGGCYPPRHTASTDNTVLDLHNSSKIVK